jgi:uncharacterized protein YkwD
MPLRVLAALALAVLLPLAAPACTLAPTAGASQTLPDAAVLNAARLDAAILARVNYARCRAGIAALAPAPALARVARVQARWMAERRNLTHNGGPRGMRSLRARLAASRIAYRAGAENIATASLYRIDGRTVGIGRAPCTFLDANRRPIPRQSYASLAAEVVTNWLASPGHRRNILDRRFRWAGSGAGFDRGGQFCGTFYLAQLFAG